MRILQHEAVAVIVDIQEKLLPHIHDSEKILKNCLKLIEGLQVLSVPFIITQQYTKGLGSTVMPVMQMFPEFNFIEKNTFSCFEESGFREWVISLNKQYVIICGVEAHVCVLQTCLDLLEGGFIPVIVEDCISSRKLNDKLIAVERMRQEGARITTVESLLFELIRRAGSDLFKSISGIVK